MDKNSGWSTAAPCVGCGKDDWCQIHETGRAICRRGAPAGKPGDWVPKLDRHGVPFHLHVPEGARLVVLDTPPKRERGDSRHLHAVYGSLLLRLSLSPTHLANLRARSLSDEAIGRHGFRSLPENQKGRQAVATSLYQEFKDTLFTVPGFHVRRGHPTIAAGSGWVLPTWNESGEVVCLRVRSDAHGNGPRYYYLSSRKHGGPAPAIHARLAWPRQKMKVGDQAAKVRITEGECKSIIAAEHTGVPTVSVPGVALWRLALPWLKKLGVKTVLLAYDSDSNRKPEVARALLDTREGLIGLGLEVLLEVWGEGGTEYVS